LLHVGVGALQQIARPALSVPQNVPPPGHTQVAWLLKGLLPQVVPDGQQMLPVLPVQIRPVHWAVHAPLTQKGADASQQTLPHSGPPFGQAHVKVTPFGTHTLPAGQHTVPPHVTGAWGGHGGGTHVPLAQSGFGFAADPQQMALPQASTPHGGNPVSAHMQPCGLQTVPAGQQTCPVGVEQTRAQAQVPPVQTSLALQQS
jgi:hypothetical protein